MNPNVLIDQNISDVLSLIGNDPFFVNETAQLKNLLEILKNNQLTLSVHGQFKRGKSTFINHLIGAPILSTGIIPVTAVVTHIRYSDIPFAEIIFEDDHKETIAFDELEKYTTEACNCGNHLQVQSVCIGYPAAFLKNNLIIADTPGVGSLHRNNTETAVEFLEKTDAAIFMLSIDSPINEIELELLKQVNHSAAKIYYVVNKTDLVGEKETAAYLEYCKEMIEAHTSSDCKRLYPISAVTAADLGIAQLMKDIEADLHFQRNNILTRSLEHKFQRIKAHILNKLDIVLASLNLSEKETEKIAADISESIAGIDELRNQAEAMMTAKTKTIIDELTESYTEIQSRRLPLLLSKIQTVADENQNAGAKDFYHILDEAINHELLAFSKELRNESAEFIKKRFTSAAEQYSAQLQEIYNRQYGRLAEKLNITPDYLAFEPALSRNSDYRFSGTQQSTAMFLNPQSLIFLLPKKTAKKVLLKRQMNELENTLKRCVTNILSDDRYRLRESVRDFQAAFRKDAGILKNTLQIFYQNMTEIHFQMEKEQAKIKAELEHKIQLISSPE